MFICVYQCVCCVWREWGVFIQGLWHVWLEVASAEAAVSHTLGFFFTVPPHLAWELYIIYSCSLVYEGAA